jgi:hypothetical protein
MHHAEALAHELTLRLGGTLSPRRCGALRQLEVAADVINDRRRDIPPTSGSNLRRSKHFSESTRANRCSGERARALAHATSSSVGLKAASSRAVTNR